MRRPYVSILLLALFLVFFFFDVCFLGKTLSTAPLLPGATPEGPYGYSGYKPEMPFSFDTGGNAWVNEPNPYILRRVLDQGALPGWNPAEGLGIPLVGNLNSEVFNPLKIFLNVYPHPFLQDIFFLLRLFVMGLFTYLFLREKNLSHLSSLFGSSFFMLSGYSVWWINLHPLSTVMYIPAVFYFYERWSEGKDLKSAFLMSLSLSFALIAGKTPDVVMGLCLLFPYALWKGLRKGSLSPSVPKRGRMFTEGGKVIMGTVSGALMASAVLFPFLELYSRASPLAKALRTGAASHTIPLITSVSLFQPLFLGWKNYYYASWLTWTPHIILPHAGIVVIVLSLCCALNRTTLMRTLPFLLFSLFLFSVVYGLLPSHLVAKLPVLGSVEFLKYNSMLYFSLAVMSASAFDDLLSNTSLISGKEVIPAKAGIQENTGFRVKPGMTDSLTLMSTFTNPSGDRKKFYLSISILSSILLAYFFFLYQESPLVMKGRIVIVLVLTLSGIALLGLIFHISRKKKRVFGIVIFAVLILELFLYMPKDRPDRFEPYKEPPYLKVIKEKDPYRITGEGNSAPPLVSNALGLYDLRGISVLLPRDYYMFSEKLLGFSVPGTNNPNPLFSATSPSIDLLGVKYIVSSEPLEHWVLEDEIKAHVASLRWIRLFDAMIKHTIKGGATYGFFHAKGEGRFSFFFPRKFAFETRLKVSEPFLFAGFAMKDPPKGTSAKIEIEIEGRKAELMIREGEGWKDQWLDVSGYMGKVITVVLRGDGRGDGRIALGNFGLSPGYEGETALYEKLLRLHKRERSFLEHRGAYGGIHIYENRNVMDRAFLLHKIKSVNSLEDVIRELQGESNFREVGLVTPPILPFPHSGGFAEVKDKGRSEEGLSLRLRGAGDGEGDKVVIKKYAPDEIAMEVESKGGLLVLSDLYYPGWKVRVNGREEEVIKAFGLLRGVVVGEGRSEVIFYYRPLSFYVGMIISLTTFVAWMVYLYCRHRSRHCRARL